MELLIVRHGIAVDRGTPGMADDERPLTKEGEKKFRGAARGLATIVSAPDIVLTSPLPRALRTAEIAAAAWKGDKPVRSPKLAAGSAAAILELLAQNRRHARVAIFGHEPDLSQLLARLLGSGKGERLALKKGGAALLELTDDLQAGRLVFYLPPKLLRALGERRG
jgi:phosphohistidine phosphatase